MGLFDGYQFNPQSFGILGLPEWLRPQEQAQAAFNTPASLPSEPAFDLSYSDYGGMRTPIFGQAPQQPHDVVTAAARMPQPVAQPVAQPTQPQGPGFGERMNAGIGGFMANAHTGPIGALLGGIHGMATGDYAGNKAPVINALKARNIDDTTIRAAFSNPGIMAAAISQAYGTKEQTNDIKEYEYARKQGYKGSLLDFTTAMHQAKAMQNNVLIDQKGETEFSKEAGKLQATRFNDLAQEAPAARQMLSDVEMLRNLGTKIQTGKGAEVRAAIGPYADALGIKIDGLSEIQAYEAIVNRVAPNLRVKGSGAQSDLELRNFLKSIPSIGNTPGGNDIVAQTLQGLYQNKVTAAEIGARALTKEITPAEAERQMRALPDPMKPWRDFNKPGGQIGTNRTLDDLLRQYGGR